MTVDADLYADEHFLAWLLDEFWVTLVSSLQRARGQARLCQVHSVSCRRSEDAQSAAVENAGPSAASI